MKWSKIIMTRFSEEDLGRIRQLATKKGLTVSSYIRVIVLEALKKEEQNKINNS